MIETKFAKIINENTHHVQIGVGATEELYISLGMIEMEVEQAYDGNWYKAGYAPIKPEPTEEEKIKNQISVLEAQITARNMRGAIFGDEFAINKIQGIETQIEELRKQLPKEEL